MVCFQGARGSGTRRWQIHRCLAVSVPLLRAWVHFPRAPEQFVASPLCLVGYVRWDARSDRVPPLQTIIFSSFTGRTKVSRPLAQNPLFILQNSIRAGIVDEIAQNLGRRME